jgi:uncharacterized protein YeeX (DUF496 family)
MKLKDHFKRKELLKPLHQYATWEWAIIAVAAVIVALSLKWAKPL